MKKVSAFIIFVAVITTFSFFMDGKAQANDQEVPYDVAGLLQACVGQEVYNVPSTGSCTIKQVTDVSYPTVSPTVIFQRGLDGQLFYVPLHDVKYVRYNSRSKVIENISFNKFSMVNFHNGLQD
ncbi:hypothetical protein [Candidatus Uabimicrobium sp. HlEnr_7]|uniref:hypothetical protein n=1 Tax=Candidatus Uabimicrobium helgolandensis TaxID=3095367 RepID=UPI003558D33B